ncbi:EamA family transporter [Amylibacter sp. SFDW26]|uniref:DMT family transporter n=1 Tax=Amylibacter sp. SFDW26 TaxID=2652722 RepID=UPI0012625CE8|nr:EamA family transporter [Amylibacter sp. SFDW26]KAB7615317.1 EamA family transporter [Amylibacter sp. SFDW26]
MTHKQLITELGFLGLLALLWGSSFMWISIGVETIPPVTLAAIRVVVASVVIGLVMLIKGQRLPTEPKLVGQLFILAMIGSIIPWVSLAWGQQFVDSALASVLNSTSPIWVLFITVLFLKGDNPPALKMIGAGLGFCGVVLIIGTDALSGLGDHIWGQFAVLLGAILYGCTSIYGRRFHDVPNTVTAASTSILSAVFLVPLSFAVDQPLSLSPSMASIGAVLMLGVFSTGIALLIYFRLLKSLGSLGVASQAYLRAGVGVGLGVFVLGETITATVGMGIAIALLGVILINLPIRSK